MKAIRFYEITNCCLQSGLLNFTKELESRYEINFEFIYIKPKEGYDYVEDDNKLVKFSDKRHGKCEEGTKEIILEDNSICSTSKAHIRSCSSKGVRLWLVVKSSIYSFRLKFKI